MQRRTISTLIILLCSCTSMLVSSHEVIMHDPKSNQGHDQIHVDPPQVTYDDELNQLTVYFGSTGNITLEYLDVANYSSLPAGYYTITIHSIYGYTYTGNFSVS